MMKKTSWILFSFSALMSGVALAKEVAVVVAAHPDDLVSCAGAALLLSEKYELHLVDTTHGERGLGEEGYRDGSCRALRIKEEEKACSLVGAKLHWLEEIDGEASAGVETVMKFEDLFKTLRPRVVLMPTVTGCFEAGCSALKPGECARRVKVPDAHDKVRVVWLTEMGVAGGCD